MCRLILPYQRDPSGFGGSGPTHRCFLFLPSSWRIRHDQITLNYPYRTFPTIVCPFLQTSNCSAPCNSAGGAPKIRQRAPLSRQPEKWPTGQYHVLWYHQPRFLPYQSPCQSYPLPIIHCAWGYQSSYKLRQQHTAFHHRQNHIGSPGKRCPWWFYRCWCSWLV